MGDRVKAQGTGEHVSGRDVKAVEPSTRAKQGIALGGAEHGAAGER